MNSSSGNIHQPHVTSSKNQASSPRTITLSKHMLGGEACKLWWSFELCWWGHKLLAGLCKPDRSKGRS